MKPPSTYLYSIALLVASTVGIGFFAIPYTFAHAGFGVGLIMFVLLTALMLTANLLYGEIILRTHEHHQFVGYVRVYLGRWARLANLFTFWVSVYGAFIGILIVNGEFLSKFLSFFGVGVSPILLSTLFVAVAVTLVYAGLKTVSHVDFVVMTVSMAIVALIALFGMPHMLSAHFVFSTHVTWFLPFGVVLFSLNAIQGIPLVRETLTGQERYFRKALVWGTLIPALLYVVFTIVVVGVSGMDTTPAAIPGLAPALGRGIVMIGSLFGFLTSSTIFLSIVTAFRSSLSEDFRLRRRGDFLLPLFPGFILFLLGVRNFIEIIGLVGGVAVSIDMILLLLVYAKVKEKGNRIPEYSINIPRPLLYCMMGMFLLGALYTILT